MAAAAAATRVLLFLTFFFFGMGFASDRQSLAEQQCHVLAQQHYHVNIAGLSDAAWSNATKPPTEKAPRLRRSWACRHTQHMLSYDRQLRDGICLPPTMRVLPTPWCFGVHVALQFIFSFFFCLLSGCPRHPVTARLLASTTAGFAKALCTSAGYAVLASR